MLVHEHTQEPINLETAAFKYGGPSLPIEFSRVSMDGRLTLVIDPQHGILQHSWHALHQSNDIHIVLENVRAREGCSLEHIHFIFYFFP